MPGQKTKVPIAVIAGDIHYDLNTIELADKGTRMAIQKANELKIPFIANGDTHNTKANLRGECVSAMIETFKTADIVPYVNIGNHCKINEKSVEHALTFLEPFAAVINEPRCLYIGNDTYPETWIIPYYHNPEALKALITSIPKGSILIMHQGVVGSKAGHYIQDKSAIPASALDGYRAILSHYHTRQDINCGTTTASYIGNLYTTTFAEANDPPKGFQVLYNDGSLEFIPTNLRKHVSLIVTVEEPGQLFAESIPEHIAPEDIVKVTLKGNADLVKKVTKERIAKAYLLSSFRLVLEPDETTTIKTQVKQQTTTEVMDSLIDSLSGTTPERKTRLKSIWKDFA